MSKKNLQKDFSNPDHPDFVLRIKTNSDHERYFLGHARFNFQKIAETWLDLLCKIKAPPGTYLFYLHEITERVPVSQDLAFNKYGSAVKSYFWKHEKNVDNFCGTLSVGFMNKEDFDTLYLCLKSAQDGELKTFDQIKVESSQKKPEIRNELSAATVLENLLAMDPLEAYTLAKKKPKTSTTGKWIIYIEGCRFLNGFSELTLCESNNQVERLLFSLTSKLSDQFSHFVEKNGKKKSFHFKTLLQNFLANPDPEKFRKILSEKESLFFAEVKKIWQNKYIPKNRKYKWTRLKELDFEKLFQEYFLPIEKEIEFRDLYFEVGHQDLVTAHKAKIELNLKTVERLRVRLFTEQESLKANGLSVKKAEELLKNQKEAGYVIVAEIKKIEAEIVGLLAQ